jgi:hypothetical protein
MTNKNVLELPIDTIMGSSSNYLTIKVMENGRGLIPFKALEIYGHQFGNPMLFHSHAI